MGEVSLHPLSTHPRSNWTIAPLGSAGDRETIAKAVEIIQAEHPYADEG
jgi:hypothetical protein